MAISPNAARQRRASKCITQKYWVQGSALALACLLAGCAPTLHLDAPAMPALDPSRTTQCTFTEKTEKLDPRPHLPDAAQSPCPAGSGLAACFTRDQDAVRQLRFKLLHDDRDYCRDAYDRAVNRVSQ